MTSAVAFCDFPFSVLRLPYSAHSILQGRLLSLASLRAQTVMRLLTGFPICIEQGFLPKYNC